MASRAVAIRRRPVPRAFARAFRSRHKAKLNISLAILAGIAPTVLNAKAELDAGNGWKNAIAIGARGLTGYNMINKQWHFSSLKEGMLPLLTGVAVHKVANRVGINSYIRRMTGGYISI